MRDGPENVEIATVKEVVESKSDLQIRLVRQLLKVIADGAVEKGARLREIELSERFGVSRTPLRAALAHLLSLGVIEKRENGGQYVAVLTSQAQQLLEKVPQEDDEQVKERIARDWFDGDVPQVVPESFFQSRYGLGKARLSRVLSMLSAEGIVSRMAGYGWQFEPTLNSLAANDSSYDFRLMIEPGAILLPGFEFDKVRARLIRTRHQRVLGTSSLNISELFRLDEEFHLFVAECSRNAFVITAITQQNKLRRLLEYRSLIDMGRMNASCLEHIEILDALEADNRELAAAAMKLHLSKAKASAPSFKV